jgi:sulfate adenylyltransferase
MTERQEKATSGLTPESPFQAQSKGTLKRPKGFCIWFTGLSGSGKTTTAEILLKELTGQGRTVTYLDGDVVRLHLSKGLGFSREDRDTNVLRIGFVASEIVRHDGAVVTAAISPYRATREQVRKMVGIDHFIEVFVDTPIEVCEQRDVKGMYARARRGELATFTGIDDPYEPPLSPEIKLDTIHASVEENVGRIMTYLRQHDFLQEEGIR